MPRFILRNTELDDVSTFDVTVPVTRDAEETFVVDERSCQSRANLVEAKFNQLVSLHVDRYICYSAADVN